MIPPPRSVRDEIRRLERLRQEDPGGLAFARLAEAYRSAGRYELALEVLEEGIEGGPPHPAGHLVLARVHHDLREPRRERAALERALELDPDNDVARRALEALPSEEPAGETGGGSGPEVPDAGTEGAADREGRPASHSPEERRELLEQLDRVSRDDWWEAGAAEPEPAGSPPDGDDDEEVVTETMGHLYARQGLWEEAESVYCRLCRSRPGDGRLARALEKVRGEEVPDRPPRRAPAPPAAPADEAAGEEGPARSEAAAPEGGTIRVHLRELLRGAAGDDAGLRADEDTKPEVRPAEAEAGDEERGDPAMDELLQRWRRAARKGDGG